MVSVSVLDRDRSACPLVVRLAFRRRARALDSNLHPPEPVPLTLYLVSLAGFGSRFFVSSSAAMSHLAPLRGTSIFAVQRIALSTSVRKSLLPQFAWKCAP